VTITATATLLSSEHVTIRDAASERDMYKRDEMRTPPPPIEDNYQVLKSQATSVTGTTANY